MSHEEKSPVFAIIGNIPNSYHSADLRNYFSQFIETGGFACFHFKHRPETQVIQGAEPNDGKDEDTLQILSEKSNSAPSTADQGADAKRGKTFCCIVKVEADRINELITKYHRKRWLDRNGESMASLCVISRIKPSSSGSSQRFRTRQEVQQRLRSGDGGPVSSNDLTRLPELNPPANVMPYGNVGTPTKYFLQMIQACRLPPNLIGKLGLKFPKRRAKRQYGDVPFDYGGDVEAGGPGEEEPLVSADGHEIQGAEPVRWAKDSAKHDDNGEDGSTENEKKEQSESDDDDCEEWERHEALHDDPSNAERNKERLYEEELEIVWEKGGPGIVWYTDAKFWHDQEGDFDEQTSDDWDVDMSVYYEPNGGDKDARDSVLMRREKRRWQGVHDEDALLRKIGAFEKHTKGVGRHVMEKQGWSEGEGLGSSAVGMKDALDPDGQSSHDKTGFGYRGERIQRGGRAPPARRPPGPGLISTVYDNPAETDPAEPLMRRMEPYHIKYRAGAMRFHKAQDGPKDSKD